MNGFDKTLLKQLYVPSPSSHKGQNGKLLIIGGSHLFHAASLWSLKVASRIVDMVFYSSVPENNEIVQKAKEEFRDGIVVKREDLEDYIVQADCVLVGPGMNREDKSKVKSQKSKIEKTEDINQIENEGEQTYYLTKYLLEKYPEKKFVLDAGALQMMEAEWLVGLKEKPILTPHQKEFETMEFKVQNSKFKIAIQIRLNRIQNLKLVQKIEMFAKEYNCIILLKGVEDIVCGPDQCLEVKGGNAGMTKGGTGDVLTGLVAALYCKNDAFLSAVCASYINKKAGDSLFERVGYYFNASDLADEIPRVMKELIVNNNVSG